MTALRAACCEELEEGGDIEEVEDAVVVEIDEHSGSMLGFGSGTSPAERLKMLSPLNSVNDDQEDQQSLDRAGT